MAADPKDTTVTEEQSVEAAEPVAQTAVAAAPAAKAGRKLSAADLIKAFESEQLKSELPDIYVGDTVKVCLLYTSPSPRD